MGAALFVYSEQFREACAFLDRLITNANIPCNDDAYVYDVRLVTHCLLLYRLLIMLEIIVKRFVHKLHACAASWMRLMKASIIRVR